jgi:glycosyltransferase involved in cell wall biosynthesis
MTIPTAQIRHLIVHQFDPAEQIAGGVHGFIADFVRLAPEHHAFQLVGVDGTGERRLGVWEDVSLGGREVRFLPVARLSASRQRRLPHTLRLIGGLLARRPRGFADYVHAHRAETGAALALAYPRTPLVQFLHTDSIEALRHRTESFWRFLPRTHLAAESFAVSRAAATWVYNAQAARRLAADFRGVRAGRNWYDDALFRPSGSRMERPLTVGWIGRLESSKNPVKAAEVFAQLERFEVGVRGWFAGAGTLKDAVSRELARHGLERQVDMVGTLSPVDLAALLRNTDVILVTSLWEGQPRAVLEALGSGVPVVSTAVGDVPELVHHGRSGFISRSGAPDELARLVVRAGKLRDRRQIAGSVTAFRASEVIGALFDDLEHLH